MIRKTLPFCSVFFWKAVRGLPRNFAYGVLTRAAASKLVLELFHSPGGIHEALFAGKGGMRIHGNVANDYVMVNTFVILGLA